MRFMVLTLQLLQEVQVAKKDKSLKIRLWICNQIPIDRQYKKIDTTEHNPVQALGHQKNRTFHLWKRDSLSVNVVNNLIDSSACKRLIGMIAECGLCGVRSCFREQGRREEWLGESGFGSERVPSPFCAPEFKSENCRTRRAQRGIFRTQNGNMNANIQAATRLTITA